MAGVHCRGRLLSMSESDWLPPGVRGEKWFAVIFLLLMLIAVVDAWWRDRRPPAPRNRTFRIREVEAPMVGGELACKSEANIEREACKLYRPDKHERTCLYVCVWPW